MDSHDAPEPPPGEEPERLDLPPMDDGDVDSGERSDDDALPVEDEGPMDPEGTEPGVSDGAMDLDVVDEAAHPDDRADGVDTGPDDAGLDHVDEPSGADDDEGRAELDGEALDDAPEELDDGAEGTSESPSDALDDKLPDLDDDADPEGDPALGDPSAFANAPLEGEGRLPWAKTRLSVIDGAGVALPCRRVVARGGTIAAAGEMLLVVEDTAHTARALPFAEKVVATAITDDGVVAATARAEVLALRGTKLVSSFASARGATAAPSVELATTPGRLWILSATTLSQAVAPAHGASATREGVLAIAASGGTLLALRASADGPIVEHVRGDDEGSLESPLTGVARAAVERADGPVLFVAGDGGRGLALASGDRVLVSRDGGAGFASLEIGGAFALTFGGPSDDVLFAIATGAPADADAGGQAVVVACAPGEEPERVAEVPRADLVGGAGIAWDASRSLLWIATSAGLVALGRPTRH